MLRAAKVPKEYIDAAKAHRCDVCEANEPPPRAQKVSRPKPYTFNHEIGTDVLDIKDNAGTFFDILNVVDYGTTFEHNRGVFWQTLSKKGVRFIAAPLESPEQLGRV